MADASLSKRDLLCILGLALAFLATIPIVDPRGNFPLIDDWSFALTAKRLFSLGDWRPLGWASMPLITQSLWAAPACLFFGCTFDALRWSTLAAALILLLCTFALFRTVGRSRPVACLAAVVSIFNPIVFSLSFTFMTDVLFDALMVVATLFFMKSFRTDSVADLLMATAFSLAATLCRQLGLCLPLAYVVAHLISSRGPLPRRLVRAVFPLIVCGAALMIYSLWLKQSGRAPALYDRKSKELIDNLRHPNLAVFFVLKNGLDSLLHFGLICFPVLVCAKHMKVRTFDWPLAVSVLAAGLIAVVLIVTHSVMPLGGNILGSGGVGPPTLRDTFLLHSNELMLPTAFWIVVTVVSLIGACLLVRAVLATPLKLISIAAGNRSAVELPASIFGAVAFGAYLVPLMIGGMFDRYIAVIVPQLLLLVTPFLPSSGFGAKGWQRGSAVVYAGLTCIFSVLATHDYLSWNRARWEAIADLEGAARADAKILDGGLEYNGLRSYDPDYKVDTAKSWWWIDQDQYQITFGPLPGLEVVQRYLYSSYLIPGQHYIYVLKRPFAG